MMTATSFAQSGADPRVNGTVVQGNTTLVFEKANGSDLDMGGLERWSKFAQKHPKIARQLANKPSLLDSAGYLRKHPDLARLFNDNPGLLAQMKSDPGNFVANAPRSQD
ncbi:MAG: hypothetical protein ACLQU2_11335 [Candidatus Binataceae bacterium]